MYLDTDRELSNFDYGNKMIEEWTQGKTSELGKQGINKFFDSVLKTCGKELVDSDFTFVIIHDRVKMSNKGMGREKIEYCKSQKIKKIDDDGKISMVEPSCDSEIDDYYKFMEKHLFMPKILIVRNSEKVLQGASAEYMSQLESRINQEASEKKTSDAAHSAEVANEKANEKASLARIEQIKATGNYSIAQNCYEYAKASNAQKLIGLPNPLVSPDGKMYFMFAKLYKFSGGSGYLESSGAYAGISTTGKTHWESKEKTLINSMVAVVGKYVGNGDVTLVSGAEQSLRNYEVMCIEPISDVGVMMELFRN